MKRKLKAVGFCIAVVSVAAVAGLYFFGRGLWVPAYLQVAGQRTVAEVVAAVGDKARARMSAFFFDAGVAYPPPEITMLALKDTAQLEVWANAGDRPTFIRSYEIKALSGVSGPKLREGDRQVPEGIYKIEGLNPNSSYHLSMKLNYPNDFDLRNARAEGRNEPGTNIFIHGKAVSIGCLAMGDPEIEELFVLTHDVGRSNVRVIIAPTDPRKASLAANGHPGWVADLYRSLESEFRRYVPSET